MHAEVERWLDARTSSGTRWDQHTLSAAKGATTVSVVLPARNEAATVGDIVRALRAEARRGTGTARGCRPRRSGCSRHTATPSVRISSPDVLPLDEAPRLMLDVAARRRSVVSVVFTV